MVPLKTFRDIENLKRVGAITARILEAVAQEVKPGVSAKMLDDMVDSMARESGVKAAFKGYRGYPSHVCISVNEEIVHGIPTETKVFRVGDIVGIDIGIYANGYYGDAALTVPVGEISVDDERLIRVTRESLYKGIEKAVIGNRLHDISSAIQRHVEESGYSIVKAFVGHGIGRSLHEDPQVPNCGKAGTGIRLKEGMVLAIEPMVAAGTDESFVREDGWTGVTKDGRKSAHFEHCVAITRQGPVILTRAGRG